MCRFCGYGSVFLLLTAVGCTPSPAIRDELGRIAKAPDPLYGPGAYLPREPNLPGADGPIGAGRGAGGRGANATAVDLRGDNKPARGVALLPPSTLGHTPAELVAGGYRPPGRKYNELSIDSPPAFVRNDDLLRRAASTPQEDDAWNQLQAALAARGVAWQRLDRTSDGRWEFQCFLPDPFNPDRGRGYCAVGDTPIAALQAAVNQITAAR
jgi:hypothetical protein